MSTIQVVLVDTPARPPLPPREDLTLARTHTLRQLRALCAERALPVAGTKPDLARRLRRCGVPVLDTD